MSRQNDHFAAPSAGSHAFDPISMADPKNGSAPNLADSPSVLWNAFGPGQAHSQLSNSLINNNAENWQTLAEEFTAESRLVADPQLAATLMAEAGRILVDRLGRQEEGHLLMRNSESPVAATMLEMRPMRSDSVAQELKKLEALARDKSSDSQIRAAAWVEFGLQCEEGMGNSARALEAFQEALELIPDHPEALLLASEAATQIGDNSLAVPLIQKRLAGSPSSRMQVALLLDQAELATDDSQRRALTQLAHEADPSEETALRRLIRLMDGTGQRATLGKLYRSLAKISEDPLSTSTALHLAFLTLAESGEPIDDLVHELTARGGKEESPELLAPLSEIALHIEQRIAAGDAEGLPSDLDILHQVAQSLDAPREQALVRERIARARLAKLQKLVGPHGATRRDSNERTSLSEEALSLCLALESDLQFCLVHLPEHRWARECLAEVLDLRGDVSGLVSHLQGWGHTESAGPDRATILLRLGDAHERLRRDLPRAAEVYELAVAENPDDPGCLRALGRVYEKMRRWPHAIATLQRQARESDDATEQVAILRRIAGMAQHELEDVDLTIATLEEIADLDHDDLLALFQLAAMARSSERVPILVKTLERLVRRLDDDVARTAILVELGEVLELKLKRRSAARDAYSQALLLTPGYAPALRSLARLHRDDGDLEALLHLHEPNIDTVTDPALLALKAARVCLDEVGDIERAIEYLHKAHQLNPDLVPAREALLQLLTANGNIKAAYDLLRAQDLPTAVPLLADYHYRLGLLAEALARKPVSTGTSEETPSVLLHHNAALQHYRSALLAQPEHGLAFERSRRILVAHNDINNLTLLLQELATRRSRSERASILVQIARLHASRGPEGLRSARDSYEEAARAAPGDPIIRREFEVLLRHMNDTDTLPAVFLQTVRGCKDTHYRATLLVEATDILLGTGKAEDRTLAGSATLEALHADPGNPYAVRHLERLLSEPDPPLAATDAVGARAVRAQSDAERAIFYLESAELLERAGAVDQARRAYQAAQSAIPGLAPAEIGMEGLSRISQDRSQPPPLQHPTHPVSVHTLMAEAREAALKAGASGSSDEGARAITILKGILKRVPNHRDAIALARALVEQLADPRPAIELIAQVLPRITDSVLRYELGLILGEHTPQLDDAARYLRAATQARPDGKEALQSLIRCYRQMGRDADAAASTEQLLELYGPNDPSAIDLRMGIAAFLGRVPESLGRALDHARVVLRARPNDPRALNLMADLLERNRQRLDAARILSRLCDLERDRGRLHDLHLRRARLFATSSEYKSEAISSVEKALFIRPGHRESIGLLAALLKQSGQIARLNDFLPSIRGAFSANISRGAVSLRDLKLLSQITVDVRPDLAHMARVASYALDSTSVPPPDGHLRIAGSVGLRAMLTNTDLRRRLYAPGELAAIHVLLQSINLVLPRMTAEFPLFSDHALVPIPAGCDPAGFSVLLNQWTSAIDISGVILSASDAHNACMTLPGTPPEIRVGNNLWTQGEPTAWRGLAAIALARHAFGAAMSRALPPIEMDIMLAACFECVGVFNAITADPEPRRLQELAAILSKQFPRKQRKVVEQACKSLRAINLIPGATARATLATDLRLAALFSGDIAGTLSAACLLDGVAGGSLKQRMTRSGSAQGLLVFVLHDDFPRLRNLVGA